MISFANDPNELNTVIRLWPDGPPSSLPCVGPEITFGSPAVFGPETVMLRNVSDPSLTVFSPDPAEYAETVAKRFAGIPAVIPGAKAPRALADGRPDESIPRAREIAAADGRRAVEIIRERAAEGGVKPDRIGMVGFSAGVFLAADLAMDPRGAPLAFIAPIYGGETQGRPVPADAPPLFTVVAQDGRTLFRVVEGLYADWSSADRPAELHIFARGGHGFGVGKRGLPVDRSARRLAGGSGVRLSPRNSGSIMINNCSWLTDPGAGDVNPD